VFFAGLRRFFPVKRESSFQALREVVFRSGLAGRFRLSCFEIFLHQIATSAGAMVEVATLEDSL